ncbi:MAG: glycosyltransferase, partial [Defluviitaleaceae bacterium]|nr:glycosyltransferase [Defluviitaleaceae bacterium]
GIWQSSGVDIVEGIKQFRGNESAVYRFGANVFNWLIECFGKVRLKDSCDFQLLDRRVVDIIVAIPERQRFFRALSKWVGFRRVQIPFNVEPRTTGTSKFNFRKSSQYALENLSSFSAAPMQIITLSGLIFFTLSALLGAQTLFRWFAGDSVEGFTTVILLLLIIGSLLMFSIGLLGFYVAKIYEEVKFRPMYLVQSTINKANKH